MSKFEKPTELPISEYSVVVELLINTTCHREAVEQARAILMSDKCPTRFIVCDINAYPPSATNLVWLDLAD